MFAGVLAIVMATSGPSTVTLVARVIARGRRGNLAFALGLILGDLVWFASAALGVAAIAT